MERRRFARFPGARGRIPNFIGAEAAAKHLAELPEWQAATVIKANPDAPQLPVRAQALLEGKVLYMAWPKLANDRPFIRIEPRRLRLTARQAASIKGAEAAGTPVAIDRMEHIDLIVCGTVAVNGSGVRIGKGGGFSDLEFALLSQAGLVDQQTTITTTVHSSQVLDRPLPETGHDFRVDIIVTPESVIRTQARRRPAGIIWDDLDRDKIDAIPVLKRLARSRG
jgi:5-formyltetrahydrofolate cyclo-ligase